MSAAQNTLWADHEDHLLRKLVGTMSCSQIANQMPGRSRNAVIGRLHRLGLTKPKPVSAPREPREREEPLLVTHNRGKPSAPVQRRLKPMARSLSRIVKSPISCRIKLVDLEPDMCKWPIGDPLDTDFCFCGGPQGDRQPYCEEHAALAYVKPSGKRSVGWRFAK